MILPGSEKYRRQPEDSERTRRRAHGQVEIDKANGIPIQQLLEEDYGIFVPSHLERSWKTNCPYDFEHPDGGVGKSMRVYHTNTAHCFDQHGHLSPVRLEQIKSDCGQLRAARILAKRFGLASKEPYWKRMNQMVLERETRLGDVGSPIHAVEALQHALAVSPEYVERQYDADVSAAFEEQLEKLDSLLLQRATHVVRPWYMAAVQEIRLVAEGGTAS